MSLRKVIVRLDADISGVQRSMRDASRSVSDGTKGMSSAFSKVKDSVGGFIRKLGDIALHAGVFKLVSSGIDMIKGSLDSAINRYDTLNNAERVFENMGFEAEEADKMMQSLIKSITGLPTPLESAVKGVQSLASSNGDLEESEQIYSALNNSVLGFGGTNEEVDRTVQMLSRSLQKGKVQGDEFNTMMDTMGPVMNAVAKEMGYTTTELQEGLSDGSIHIDDFTDTLLRMNEEGGGGLASLEQIARDSTDGIGTSMENVQNAVNRGMAKFIEAVDEALEDNGLPGISEMIQLFGETIE